MKVDLFGLQVGVGLEKNVSFSAIGAVVLKHWTSALEPEAMNANSARPGEGGSECLSPTQEGALPRSFARDYCSLQLNPGLWSPALSLAPGLMCRGKSRSESHLCVGLSLTILVTNIVLTCKLRSDVPFAVAGTGTSVSSGEGTGRCVIVLWAPSSVYVIDVTNAQGRSCPVACACLAMILPCILLNNFHYF